MALKNKNFSSESSNEFEEVEVMVAEDELSDNDGGIDTASEEDSSFNEEDTEKVSNEKKQNFQRLAEARMTKVLKSISLLGNLSNRSSYEFTDEQVEEMFSAIEEVIAETRSKFMPKKKETKFWFKS